MRVFRSVTFGVTVFVLVWGPVAWQVRAAYVITTQGKKVEGSDIRAKSDGQVVLMTPQGTRTFYKGQYLRAVADKPADFDRALKAGESKRYDEAIPLLRGIIQHYRYLEWDNRARLLLAKIYFAKGDYKEAVDTYEELLKYDRQAAKDSKVNWSYREALLKAGEYTKLKKVLDEVIAAGPRDEAARAQILRGDMWKAQKMLEDAVLDYLRTVVLFKAQKQYQPEALFKAAETLEALRDQRAKDLYRELVQKYPDSPYAAKARRKL